MDETKDGVAEPNTDDMRDEIDCTRSAMADKLEALEDRVMGTVQNAQETMDDSIQMAKDTVATVKRTFDIKYQVEQHPWAMLGGSFVIGLALGGLFRKGPRRSPLAADQLAGTAMPLAESSRSFVEQRSNGHRGNAAQEREYHSTSAPRPGFFGQFQEEIDKVKGIGIGYVVGLVGDSIKSTAPQLASQIDDVMNGIATKLGSKPIH